MTRVEFAKAIGYIGAGTGKPLPEDALEVYFDLLGDLPYQVLLITAKRVLLEHKWATFPSIAELREAASGTQRGLVSDLSPPEAWEIAWAITGQTDPEIDGSYERAVKRNRCPPLVEKAIKSFGLMPLCYNSEPVGMIRSQFIKIYEQLLSISRKEALMPKKLVSEIKDHEVSVSIANVISDISKQMIVDAK